MADQLDFSDIWAARTYIREMSVEDTEAIGDYEVWRFDSGAILVIEPGAQVGDVDDAKLIGTVTETLCDARYKG